MFWDHPEIIRAVECDLQAVIHRDPASRGYSAPLLYFKGFHSIQAYRVAHHYWTTGRESLALFLQSRISGRSSPSTFTRGPGSARDCCSTTPPRW